MKFPDFFPHLEELHVLLQLVHRSNGIFVVFQNLHTLYAYNWMELPMTHITAPNLKNLFIKNMVDVEPCYMLYFSDVLSFLKRSQPRLQVIQICGLKMTHEEFIMFLEMVPNLVEFDIVNTPISTSSLMALTLPVKAESPGTTKFLCPDLCAMQLDCVTAEETLVNEPSESSLVPLVRALLATRCVADPSARIQYLDYIGLPLKIDELELLKGECRLLGLETKIYSTLIKGGSW